MKRVMSRIGVSLILFGFTVVVFSGCQGGGEDPHLDTLKKISNTVSFYRTDIAQISSLDSAEKRYGTYNTEIRGLVDELDDRSGRMSCDVHGMSEMTQRMHRELDRFSETVDNLSNLEEMKEECERHGEEMEHHVEECEGMHGGGMHHRMGGG